MSSQGNNRAGVQSDYKCVASPSSVYAPQLHDEWARQPVPAVTGDTRWPRLELLGRLVAPAGGSLIHVRGVLGEGGVLLA